MFFRSKGYDIGSGAVEGACGHVVGDRGSSYGCRSRWLLEKSTYKLQMHPAASNASARHMSTFRQKGNTAIARKHLQKALSVNKYVPQYLLGDEQLPQLLPPSYRLGSKEEAVLCADLLKDAWHSTPDAVEWLGTQT